MTLFELARHPEFQSKLRDEVDSVLERHQGKVTFDALQEMTYMDKVVFGKSTDSVTMKNCNAGLYNNPLTFVSNYWISS